MPSRYWASGRGLGEMLTFLSVLFFVLAFVVFTLSGRLGGAGRPASR